MDELIIHREGIYKLIKNINPNKAGPDNITGKIF
jgi:hypothetical protein